MASIDPQLLESVQRALEQDGLLQVLFFFKKFLHDRIHFLVAFIQSIKAKIRSSVARIIKDAGDHQKIQSPEVKAMSTPDGMDNIFCCTVIVF